LSLKAFPIPHTTKTMSTLGPSSGDEFAGGMSVGLFILLVIVPVVVYLGLNILGTVYYSKVAALPSVTPGAKSVSLLSVVFGWVVCPLFNVVSPIVYANAAR